MGMPYSRQPFTNRGELSIGFGKVQPEVETTNRNKWPGRASHSQWEASMAIPFIGLAKSMQTPAHPVISADNMPTSAQTPHSVRWARWIVLALETAVVRGFVTRIAERALAMQIDAQRRKAA